MNVGRAITCAMRAQRRRDLHRMAQAVSVNDHYALQGWLMFGWAIVGHRHLGVPGSTFPYWIEPRWMWRRIERELRKG